MGKLVNKATGEREVVDDADIPALVASGKYEDPGVVAVHRFGEDTYVAPDVAADEKAYTPTTTDAQVALSRGHAERENENTGVVASGKALVGGAISGASAGLFNPFEDEQEFNQKTAFAGNMIGTFAPSLFGDEAGLAKMAADPLEVERAGSALSSKFLYAGEVGAGANTAAKVAEKGLTRAGKALEDARGVVDGGADLAHLDVKGLSAAHDAELSRLADEQRATFANARAATVQDLAAYRDEVKKANPWLAIDEGPESAQLTKANRAMRDALNTPKALAENPRSLLRPLETEEQALQSAIGRREEIATKLDAVNGKIAKDLELDLQTLPDAAKTVELSGRAARRYASFADVKLGKAATLSVAREDAQGFLDALKAGEVRGAGQEALDQLPQLLEKNRALQDRVRSAVAPMLGRSDLTSDRLAAIKSAKESLMVPSKPRSLMEDMLGGTIMGHVTGALAGMPIIGPAIGAKAGRFASDLIFGRLGKATAEAGMRTKDAVSAFLNTAKRAASSPMLATRILARTAFAPRDPEAPQPRSLAANFKARSSEIKSQTMYDETGTPVMRPEARQAVNDRLAAVRANSPVLADKLETIAARRMEFLSSKLPRRPDLPGVLSGPDRWQPSDMEMRTFARYVAAVEDPGAVEERLAAGTVTPEDAEAYRTVYPERFYALQSQILQSLPQLKKTLPYQRRLSFSIFTGVPVDPSMAPNVVAALQSSFEQEPGSEGGMQAPKPQPQFGSVKKSIEAPTPAQHRAQ